MTTAPCPVRTLATWTRCLLGVAMSAAALLKVFGGYDPAGIMSEGVTFVVAGAEAVAASMLFLGLATRVSAGLILGLCVAGIVGSVLSGRPCGCLGASVQMNAEQHAVMSAGIGLLAIWHLAADGVSRSSSR